MTTASPLWHRTIRWWRVLGCALLCLLASLAHARLALDFLRANPAPNFRPGHTMEPLTRWAWPLSYDLNVELTERWGYALDIDPGENGEKMSNPASQAYRLATLAATDPEKYPVSVNVFRPLLTKWYWYTLPPDIWCYDPVDGSKAFSPICPDSVYQDMAARAAANIAAVRKVCPISILIHGAEDGLMVWGNSGAAYNDPRVVAAKGDLSWDTFLSRRKAAEVMPTREACIAAAGGDVPMIYFVTGDLARGIAPTHWEWAWNYDDFHQVSDYPSWQTFYYADGRWVHGDYWWSYDILTLLLNGTAQGIASGHPLGYHWVAGGWSLKYPDRVSDDPHYMGYLKSMYTAGTLGAVAGYFLYPPGGFSGDIGETEPIWLRQLQILGHAHGAFTHLEDFLRRGDLEPGPAMHKIWKEAPAYEFPVDGDPTARVLARKHKNRAEWLICAWAAGGDDRHVTVTIPGLGEVTLFARGTATLYRAKPGALILLDPDGMRPSLNLCGITASAGANGAISADGYIPVPRGGSETFTFTPDSGYAVAEVLVDGASVGAPDAYTFTDVTESHTLSVSFTTAHQNTAPTAADQTLLLSGQPSAGGTLQAQDADGDALTFAVQTDPAFGTVALDAATGVFTYTAGPGFSTGDSFTFTASDGQVVSNAAKVTINAGFGQRLIIHYTGTMTYQTGGIWKPFPQGGLSLPPGTYWLRFDGLPTSFTLAKGVDLERTVVRVQLLTAAGAGVSGGTGSVYFNGGWRGLPVTNAAGSTLANLAGDQHILKFAMTYQGVRREKTQDISVESTVVFRLGE